MQLLLLTLLIILLMNTSTDACGQVDELTESLVLKVVAQVIFLGGADFDIPHNQGILFGVNDMLQMLAQSGEGLI